MSFKPASLQTRTKRLLQLKTAQIDNDSPEFHIFCTTNTLGIQHRDNSTKSTKKQNQSASLLLFRALRLSISRAMSSILRSASILCASSSSARFSALVASFRLRLARLSASLACSASCRASSHATSRCDFSARSLSSCSRSRAASSRERVTSSSAPWSFIALFSSCNSFSRSSRLAHSRCLRCSDYWRGQKVLRLG